MAGASFVVNSRRIDGSLRRSWAAELVDRTDLVLELAGTFRESVDHPDLGEIAAGTISKEVFFYDRWFNYFEFLEPDGRFRNYYFNICLPPTISEASVDYVDLDIDLIVWPDRSVSILDVEEFETDRDRFKYPPEISDGVFETLEFLKHNWEKTLIRPPNWLEKAL